MPTDDSDPTPRRSVGPSLELPDVLGPMFGIARQAQAALADAALAGLQGALTNAQKVVETTRTAARERATQEWRGAPVETAAGLQAMSEAVNEQSREALDAMSDLAKRRTEALLSFPAELAACRTPQDVLSAQVRFWQAAASDCAEGGRRMLTAMSSGVTHGVRRPNVADVVGQPAGWTSKSDREKAAVERAGDRITFREPGQPPAITTDPTKSGPGGSRRVA
jgi:hypothetical protein